MRDRISLFSKRDFIETIIFIQYKFLFFFLYFLDFLIIQVTHVILMSLEKEYIAKLLHRIASDITKQKTAKPIRNYKTLELWYTREVKKKSTFTGR